MTIKKFIDRPLLSIVINVMVVAVGIIALTRLPIEKFPDIAPPTVYLWASYPGASAETVQKSVVAPLEQAINGVDNMMYMTSSASNGSASISIYFKQGTNADMAAVNVQNRVVQAQAQLPAEVLRFGVAVEKQQPGQLRILALESPGGTYDENFLSNYFYNNLRPAILRIQGVGKCEVWGGQYALIAKCVPLHMEEVQRDDGHNWLAWSRGQTYRKAGARRRQGEARPTARRAACVQQAFYTRQWVKGKG